MQGIETPTRHARKSTRSSGSGVQQRFFAGLHFQADLGALTADLKVFPQVIVNVNVREKKHLESIPAVAQAIRGAEEELRDSGRVVVRYSGTEPMAWVMIEAESEEATRRHAKDVVELFKLALGEPLAAAAKK